jgi:alcohol dehydrogenase
LLISSITACGKCVYCPRKPCILIATNSGWVLGNRIDGTQAESLRIPYAETSLYPVPAGVDEKRS